MFKITELWAGIGQGSRDGSRRAVTTPNQREKKLAEPRSDCNRAAPCAQVV